jgi:hypothetical protein
LLIGGKIPAKYYTFGPEYSPDIRIGRRIAETFQLSYEARIREDEDTAREWSDGVWSFVRRTDGMANLEHIHTLVHHPQRVAGGGVRLGGGGGRGRAASSMMAGSISTRAACVVWSSYSSNAG